TVPVGTNEKIKDVLARHTSLSFDIVSAPEFLREGSAINDTLHPDRIIIGLDNTGLRETMVTLHQVFTDKIYVTDIRSAE
ncbi:UDP-glucose 6-dehydrogenase, partial [Bacillus cereus]|nr:UDP-glucose 6-dehydrogenase [Bacillus cereus]